MTTIQGPVTADEFSARLRPARPDAGTPYPARVEPLSPEEYERRKPNTLRARVLRKLWAEPDSCAEWPGLRDRAGYGMVQVRDYPRRAHRAFYEWIVGEIPDGLVLDHLCRNPPCVNPRHLEPVTSRENTLRGVGTSAVNAQKEVCKNGHPLDEVNTGLQTRHGEVRGRFCRPCKTEWQRQNRAARRTP